MGKYSIFLITRRHSECVTWSSTFDEKIMLNVFLPLHMEEKKRVKERSYWNINILWASGLSIDYWKCIEIHYHSAIFVCSLSAFQSLFFGDLRLNFLTRCNKHRSYVRAECSPEEIRYLLWSVLLLLVFLPSSSLSSSSLSSSSSSSSHHYYHRLNHNHYHFQYHYY